MQKSSLPVISLVCGILSWIFLPFVLGIAAWITGQQALNQMDEGLIDSSDRTVATIGKLLGMINVILSVIGGCCFLMIWGGIFATLIGTTPQ